MRDMFVMNATDVRKNWSEVADTVIRSRPQFIKRTRDYMMLSNCELVESLLEAYRFTADKLIEADGSVTLSLIEIDLIENAATEEEAKELLAKSIMEYAAEFYEEFSLWSSAPNRKGHVPYVMKALIFDDVQRIKECITCQAGKN